MKTISPLSEETRRLIIQEYERGWSEWKVAQMFHVTRKRVRTLSRGADRELHLANMHERKQTETALTDTYMITEGVKRRIARKYARLNQFEGAYAHFNPDAEERILRTLRRRGS